jgi:hypothetical protein
MQCRVRPRPKPQYSGVESLMVCARCIGFGCMSGCTPGVWLHLYLRVSPSRCRYEASKLASRREVALVRRQWRAEREGLTSLSSHNTGVSAKVCAWCVYAQSGRHLHRLAVECVALYRVARGCMSTSTPAAFVVLQHVPSLRAVLTSHHATPQVDSEDAWIGLVARLDCCCCCCCCNFTPCTHVSRSRAPHTTGPFGSTFALD